MKWIVFSYSLPTGANTARVTLWRRLRRLGAISPTGSVYILPAQDDCVESFQWLAREIQQAGGETLVMHVSQFEGLDDRQLIALFNQSRHEEYEEILGSLADLERQIAASEAEVTLVDFQSTLHKLQKQQDEVARIDYFQCPLGRNVTAQLNRIKQQLAPNDATNLQIATVGIAQYQDKQWVTRPRPHVDRLASAWLIRRYLNAEASIRYAVEPEPGEVGFDMDGAEFSHQGNLCTFEVMLRAFQLDEPALHLLAEIVHEIDLRDGRYQRPETSGIDSTLRGWLLAGVPDSELERLGIGLFEGLYAALSSADRA